MLKKWAPNYTLRPKKFFKIFDIVEPFEARVATKVNFDA